MGKERYRSEGGCRVSYLGSKWPQEGVAPGSGAPGWRLSRYHARWSADRSYAPSVPSSSRCQSRPNRGHSPLEGRRHAAEAIDMCDLRAVALPPLAWVRLGRSGNREVLRVKNGKVQVLHPRRDGRTRPSGMGKGGNLLAVLRPIREKSGTQVVAMSCFSRHGPCELAVIPPFRAHPKW